MTVTFKERREIARQLREMAERKPCGFGGYRQLEAHAERAKAIMGTNGRRTVGEVLERYADLIDAPSCRDETPDGPEFTCSLCGCRLRRMAGQHGSTLHYVGMGFRTPPHCPLCGAVVE